MKKQLFIISLFLMLGFFSTENQVVYLNQAQASTCGSHDASISDKQKTDIELIFDNTDTASTIVPELQGSITAPSFRVIASQKKSQQNFSDSSILKRFSSEVHPTKNYNTRFSFPLSSRENLIVIVRHLII